MSLRRPPLRVVRLLLPSGLPGRLRVGHADAVLEVRMTHREFIAKYPEYGSMPEYICGKGGRRIRFMDSTLEDFRAYAQLLESRIRRHTRGLAPRSPSRRV